MYNPTPNSLDVRWDPAPGPVQQYRIVYSPVAGTRPSESVSNLVLFELSKRAVWTLLHLLLWLLGQTDKPVIGVAASLMQTSFPDELSLVFVSCLVACVNASHKHGHE